MTIKEKDRLNSYMSLMLERTSTSIGYPFSVDFDYSELLPLLHFPLINLGDPFLESNYGVNSFDMEREVVEYFAGLFHAPKHNFSGYVTSGGSEGNLYGLYIAREQYPDAMVYYSSAAHYSVTKGIRLLNMSSVVIDTQSNGEINYDALESTLRRYPDRPSVVIANIGTTMTEAKDDVPRIREILLKNTLKPFYIHCDAALAGIYLALLEEDSKFDFACGADSITCSGHKFIGSPIPCGVVVVKKDTQEHIGHRISYIGSSDTTVGGSRNGHSPVFLWYAIKKLGREGLLKRAFEAISLASYTRHKLLENGISSWRNNNAITVVFPEPPESICRKWQLATEAGQAHLICMPGISKEKIDDFISDLVRANKDRNTIVHDENIAL